MDHATHYPDVENVNPKPILGMNYAFAQTALLMAAVRLHIFSYLASDPLTATTLVTLVIRFLSSQICQCDEGYGSEVT